MNLNPNFLKLGTVLILVATAQAQKIELTPSMITNESGEGDATLLVDEQAEAGDPRDGSGGKPKTFWNDKGVKEIYYPLTAYIDLGGLYHLTDVFLYDTNGEIKVVVESGKPFDWQPLLIDPMKTYNKWNRHEVDIRTRFLRVTLPRGGGGMTEIVLYGSPEGAVTKPVIPEAKVQPFPKMDELVGTNAFVDDPIDKVEVFGYIREYHSWSWDVGDGKAGAPSYPNNLPAWQPSRAEGGKSWFFDTYYQTLKDKGVMVCPAIKGSANWLWPKGDHRPADPGQDPNLPASYRAHADHLFQYAARYGSTKVDDAKLKVVPDQARATGLGTLRYFENGNEEDGWWAGPDAYSNPYQLAAQCSADYDGHRKTMGDTFGVKNADPNAKLVMGGLAGLSFGYIKAMKAWADWNRDGEFPADVINVHTYSNDLGGQGASQRGVSPEQDKLKEKLQELVDYRNRYLPGKELWLSEFGYDTHPKSIQGAPQIGATSNEETQARWLVRSYLAIAAAGVDRAAQYMLRDVGNGPGKYNTSGLVTGKGEWKPKPSWFYVATLKNRLTGMRFAGEMSSGDPKVWIYKFRADDGRGAYAVWCPTAENATVAAFSLPVPGAKEAKRIEFVDQAATGKESPLIIESGRVPVDVSENTVLILVDQMAP
jgi:hypothetical protein